MKPNHFILVIVTISLLSVFSSSCKDDKVVPKLTVSKTELSFPVDGDSSSLFVESNVDWSVGDLPSWIHSSKVSGIGNSSVIFKADANDNIDDRDSIFKVYTNDNSVICFVKVIQDGTHVSPFVIQNNTEKYFSGKAYNVVEDSIVIISNTRWTIDGPSWLSASFKGSALSLNGDVIRNGSGTIYLKVNESYSGENARKETIRIMTLDEKNVTEIPVIQLGKYDIHCTDLMIISDGYLFDLKFGTEVAGYQWEYFTEEILPSDLTYSNIQSWWYNTASAPGEILLWVGSYEPNKEIYLYFIGVDQDSYYVPLDKIHKKVVRTASDVDQPIASIQNVEYNDGKWSWDINMNEKAGGYYFNVFFRSVFETYYPDVNYSLYKPYFAYSSIISYPAFSKTSGPWALPTTDDIIICAWAVGKDNKLSNVVDYYVTDKFTSKPNLSNMRRTKNSIQVKVLNKDMVQELKALNDKNRNK